MKQRRIVRLVALLAVVALIGAACSSKKPAGVGPSVTQKPGGTFHIVVDELFWVLSGNGFDPSFEYLTTTIDIFSNLMLRNLTTFNHTATGVTPVPDIATGLGEYSPDHMSITYHLKSGIKFGPPINREVTSQDIAYAIERVSSPDLDTGGYPSYYTDFIKGIVPLKNDATYVPVPGIVTPDAHTITFKFTQPSYDWDNKMALPAASPIPPEIGKCFPKPSAYGQYVVSTGPYSISGMDALDPSSCKAFTAKKPAGFNFSKFLTLDRNPSYDPTTDSKTVREALPDHWKITQDTNVKDCFQLVEANKIDWCDAAVTGDVIQTYQTTPALKNLIHSNDDNSTWFISMNLTEPPFDDIHVRKAINLALDKSAMERLRGGPLTTTIAEHVIPPSVLGGQLGPGQFDPYATPNHAGDVTKAKAEMMLSKYDTNHDGLCDVQTAVAGEHRTVCGSTGGPIVIINRATEPYKSYEPVIQKAFNSLGITVRFDEGQGFYGRAGKVSAHPVLGSGGGWGPDWPAPGAFLGQTFTSSAIHAQTYNVGLVGITQALATKYGALFPSVGVPTVDADYTHCSGLQVQSDQVACWIALDKKLMTEVIAWVPYRWGKTVRVLAASATGYEFDAFSTEVSMAHLGLDVTKQAGTSP